MPSLKATFDTYLKKFPVESSTLPDDQKRLVNNGEEVSFEKKLQEKDGHIKVRLSYGAGDWWVYREHFESPAPAQKVKHVKEKKDIYLPVRYFSQLDNYRDAGRTCFSSSCAMLLDYIKPGVIKSDDDYVRVVFSIGDTTNYSVQLEALSKFGVSAEFRQDLTWEDVESQLENKVPVPVGILHKGNVEEPVGRGHWIIIIGCNKDRTKFLVHDPYGDLDLVEGIYVSSKGQSKWYSKENLTPRWQVAENPGWGIILK